MSTASDNFSSTIPFNPLQWDSPPNYLRPTIKVTKTSCKHTNRILPSKERADFKVLLLTYKALHGLAPTYLSDLVLIWSYIPTVHIRYGHKTQASLLFLEFLSKQLEARLSPIELNFYGMVCLSMWETQTRSRPSSTSWRLISSGSPMSKCRLAQGCEGEWKGTGATNHPCCLCLAGSPLSNGILCL